MLTSTTDNNSIYYKYESKRNILIRRSRRNLYRKNDLSCKQIVRFYYNSDDNKWIGFYNLQNQYLTGESNNCSSRLHGKIIDDFLEGKQFDKKQEYVCVLKDSNLHALCSLTRETFVIHTNIDETLCISEEEIKNGRIHELVMPIRVGLLEINPSDPSLLLMGIFFKCSIDLAITLESLRNIRYNLSEKHIKFLKDLMEDRHWLFAMLDPNNHYRPIHQLFSENDPKYFQKKLSQCFSKISYYHRNSMSHCAVDFWTEIIYRAKREMGIECVILIERFLNFPHEMENIRAKFANNAYFKLVNSLFKRGRGYHDTINHGHFDFFENTSSFTDQWSVTNAQRLISIIMARSLLFQPLYDEYIKTKQSNVRPLITGYHCYYPMRVFLPSLLILERVLAKIK